MLAATLTESGATFGLTGIRPLPCTLDVGRIIEQPLPFEGDCAEVELTVATHARSPRLDNVRTPGSIAHLSAIDGIYGNATVDNRDEVRVCQRVEYSFVAKNGQRKRR